MSFTDDEKEQLRKFTNRSYLLDKTSRHQAWLSLVDILLAYTYEVRSTEGDHSVSMGVSLFICVCMCEETARPEQHLALDDKALYPQIL